MHSFHCLVYTQKINKSYHTYLFVCLPFNFQVKFICYVSIYRFVCYVLVTVNWWGNVGRPQPAFQEPVKNVATCLER